ncbi:MAG: hypothetical protein NZ866_02810, partial [Patescibacteria group bacterium]|nr:hypothetical protein [Patescibacteria group bacterium]
MKIISKSFTLIELIIAVLIIFLIVGLFILIIKPGDYFQNTRDSKRIDDLKKLETILDVLSLEDLNLEEGLSNNTIYISLPDSSPTCSSWISQLMILPQNWQYRCSS